MQADDVQAIVHGKLGLKYAGSQVDSMKAIATAHKRRSIQEFEKALTTYKDGSFS
jgi:26S proteasome regulatory subunit N6